MRKTLDIKIQAVILYLKEALTNFNLIAIIIAILTTGFLRLQIIGSPPSSDGGFYSFTSQWLYNAVAQDIIIKDSRLFLYQFMVSWVYALDVNQIILLRIIDGFVAIAASIVLFNVILKESGSKLFTVILIVPLLIILHDFTNVLYGFRNSIWASYLALFGALILWQKYSKEGNFSFYLIGALISMGVLLREALLPFSVLAGIAIYVSYGGYALVKYLIGSAVLGFSVLIFMLMFRGWDLQNLIDAYTLYAGLYRDFSTMGLTFKAGMLHLIQTGWFVCILSIASIFYFIKINFSDKKSVSANRFYFWVLVALIPLIEPIFKLGFHYHYSNSLIGLAGLCAMSWKYLSIKESKQIKKLSIILIGLLSLFVVIPTVNSNVIKVSRIILPSNAILWAKTYDSFRYKNVIESSQYLTLAAKIYSLSKEDSTLVTSGMMQVLHPLTNLLPPTYELSWLRYLYVKMNFDENKLIKIIKKHRPTLIVTTDWSAGEAAMSEIIDKIDIYEKVAVIPSNSTKTYGYKSGTIFRLKDY